jgi:hypothetical protein
MKAKTRKTGTAKAKTAEKRPAQIEPLMPPADATPDADAVKGGFYYNKIAFQYAMTATDR